MGWNKGLICMVDALGTKGRWKYENPDIFLGRMSAIRESLLERSKYFYKEEFEKFGFPQPRMNFLSDTLIITQSVETNDEKDISLILHRFTKHLSGLLASSLIFKIFFRGVISYGDYLQDNYCLIGPAVDEAASVYEVPQLIGIILHNNVNRIIIDYLDFFNTFLNHFIINYSTPIKFNNDYCNSEHYIINWSKTLLFMQKESNINTRNFIINQFCNSPVPDENAKRKLDNSLHFFDFAINNTNKLSAISQI